MSRIKNWNTELEQWLAERKAKGFDDQLTGRSVNEVPKYAGYEKCAYTHKPMPVELQGGTRYIYGGAAGSPVYKDCDIFVALDGSTPEDKSFYPWNEGNKKTFVSFYITDMQVPKDREEFKKMIEWLCHQVMSGHKVHVGCMGGHGRTGMVLAAMVKWLMAEEDAITYVRKNYCDRAVETKGQVDFLHEEFGIAKVSGTKGDSIWFSDKPSTSYRAASTFNDKYGPKPVDPGFLEVTPFEKPGSIWYPKGIVPMIED